MKEILHAGKTKYAFFLYDCQTFVKYYIYYYYNTITAITVTKC